MKRVLWIKFENPIGKVTEATKGQGQSTFDNKSEQKEFSKSKKCYFCVRDFHKRQFCPARNATCNNCTKKGHFQAVCKSLKTVCRVLIDEQSSSSDQEIPCLGAVHNTNIDKQWSVEVCLDNTKVNFKIDAGAGVDIILDKIYRNLFNHKPQLGIDQSDCVFHCSYYINCFIKNCLNCPF